MANVVGVVIKIITIIQRMTVLVVAVLKLPKKLKFKFKKKKRDN